MTSAFTAERIVNWKSCAALAPFWNLLLKQSNADTIFLTWEWFESWAKVVDGFVEPFVVVVRTGDGTLTGIAPYYRTAYRLFPGLSVRALRFMADRITGAEYPDWILRKDVEEEAARAIAGALKAARSEWDCIWMTNIAGWTGAQDRIAVACRAEEIRTRCRSRDFAHFALPVSKEAYLGSLTPNRRSQIGRQTRKVFAREDMGFSRCLRDEDMPRYLESLFDLNRKRWAAQGQVGPFVRRPDAVRFYRCFAPLALREGWLRLYALEEKAEIKAIQIGYVYNSIYHQLQEGFDPEYAAGVGNVLRLHVIEQCIAEGVREYDFLGEMTEHKRRWTALLRTGCDILATSETTMGKVLAHLPIWPTGRWLRPEHASTRRVDLVTNPP